MPTEIIDPSEESQFSASETQNSGGDITLSRFGTHLRSTADSTTTTPTTQWVADLVNNTINPSFSFAGVISEVLVFDRKLTEEERQEVYGYLSRKYSMDTKLPDTYTASHPSAYARGLTFWNIEHHPNTKGIPGLWQNLSFGDIVLEDFSLFPDGTYKSTGNVLSEDTYGSVGL
jgi:hypothetical protein